MNGIDTCCLPDRASKTGRYISAPAVGRLEMTLNNEIVQRFFLDQSSDKDLYSPSVQ